MEIVSLGLIFLLSHLGRWGAEGKRTFKIDGNNHTFLMDGKPFRYVSGSLHYFRIPREYWEDRLRKVRAAGLNAVQVYVEWSSHEPEYGHYYFSGQNDIEKFIQLAHQQGLYVLLRPGPFIGKIHLRLKYEKYFIIIDNCCIKFKAEVDKPCSYSTLEKSFEFR